MDLWCNPVFRDNFIIILTLLVVWTVPWKALALWKSARNGQKIWFLIFMIINTVGLLEIFYLLVLPRFKK
ncbi:MAG: hypothetical protein FJZ04_00765 [Candidatus Moranbacteria bacterium]|nr:hypothetical protein [Candidatus Moranbacteria bacterium]